MVKKSLLRVIALVMIVFLFPQVAYGMIGVKINSESNETDSGLTGKAKEYCTKSDCW